MGPGNRNQDELATLARDVASAALHGELPNLEYERNHHDEPDVAVFDFATLSIVDYSCLAKQRCGKDLLQVVVGDSAIEVSPLNTYLSCIITPLLT